MKRDTQDQCIALFVDFENLASRNAMYREMEARSLQEFLAHPERDLTLVPGHDCRLLGQADEMKAREAQSAEVKA
jgi:hypothetical protein